MPSFPLSLTTVGSFDTFEPQPSGLFFLGNSECFVIVSSDSSRLLAVNDVLDLHSAPLNLTRCLQVHYNHEYDSFIFISQRFLSVRRHCSNTFLLKSALDPVEDGNIRLEITHFETKKLLAFYSRRKIYLSDNLVMLFESLINQMQKQDDFDAENVSCPWKTIILCGPFSTLRDNLTALLALLHHDGPLYLISLVSLLLERLKLSSSKRSYNLKMVDGMFDKSVMESEAARRMTFMNWPHSHCRWLIPSMMSSAGFFYEPDAQNDDRVVCFSCSICLIDWQPLEKPLTEHRLHSPQCPFVRCKPTKNVSLTDSLGCTPPIAHHLSTEHKLILSNTRHCPWLAVGSVQGRFRLWHMERVVQSMTDFSIDLTDPCIRSKTEYLDPILDDVTMTAMCTMKSTGKFGTVVPSSSALILTFELTRRTIFVNDYFEKERHSFIVVYKIDENHPKVASFDSSGGATELASNDTMEEIPLEDVMDFCNEFISDEDNSDNLSLIETMADDLCSPLKSPALDADQLLSSTSPLDHLIETPLLMLMAQQCFRLPLNVQVQSLLPSPSGSHLVVLMHSASDNTSSVLVYRLSFCNSITSIKGQPERKHVIRTGIRKAILLPRDIAKLELVMALLTDEGRLNIIDLLGDGDILCKEDDHAQQEQWVNLVLGADSKLCLLNAKGRCRLVQLQRLNRKRDSQCRKAQLSRNCQTIADSDGTKVHNFQLNLQQPVSNLNIRFNFDSALPNMQLTLNSARDQADRRLNLEATMSRKVVDEPVRNIRHMFLKQFSEGGNLWKNTVSMTDYCEVLQEKSDTEDERRLLFQVMLSLAVPLVTRAIRSNQSVEDVAKCGVNYARMALSLPNTKLKLTSITANI